MVIYVELISLKESSTQSLHTSIFINYLHFYLTEQNNLYIFSHLQLKDYLLLMGSQSAFHKDKQSLSHFVWHTTHVPRIPHH